MAHKGLDCLRCSGPRIRRLEVLGKSGKLRKLYWCLDCEYQFSATVGTVFHDSHLPLSVWFTAIRMTVSTPTLATARIFQRDFGITYESAWNLKQRIQTILSEEGDFAQVLLSSLQPNESGGGASTDLSI